MYSALFRVLAFVLLFLFASPVDCLPKKKGTASNGNGNGNSAAQTAQQQAAAIPGGISKATDGSTILDKTVTIKYTFLSVPAH